MKTVSILLCALFVFASTFAQEFQLSGNVTNSKNEPIEGVSIFIKGTTTGTETNALGNYNFSLEKEQYTIVVSYVGMITQEQTINLEEDVTANFVLLSFFISVTIEICVNSLKSDIKGLNVFNSKCP